MTIALVAFAFLFVLAVVLGVYWVAIVRPETQAQSAVRKRLKVPVLRTTSGPPDLLKRADRLSHIAGLETLLGRSKRITGPVQRLLTQSGVRLTVGKLVLASGCASLTGMLALARLTGYPWLALPGAAFGALPFLYVLRARTKRTQKFEEIFPEAVDLIARALRAGHALPTGLSMVAEELPDPVGTEFRLLYERQNFGLPLPESLRVFAERALVLDARFFVTAVLTQREAGGNLAEVLDNLAAVMRERFKVKRQMRVLSAHGRITGWVLIGLPPVLALAFTILSPAHMRTLIDDPLGIQMMVGAGALQLIGTFIIRKVVNIEY